ncbi:hypothetical protein [Tardiphaga sp.]|uniref:hypothetical protein n=1 Tax=Tardiphaga sp. TaxID=1926292 RepID=UPI0026261F9B|nr:hypothetical protein [Tardiphaga sp.]MDB5621057.1 hypothetical protein [Tardiphaga sp.]
MFAIDGNHVAELNDEDLRSLVGLLCEAQLRSHELSTSAVTWGGNQSAADGGIDVRIRIEDGAVPGGFIPRKSIGFQVKKTDFTPGLIGSEMRPSGQLRASISNLIDEGGSYIIVSSGSDTSDSALSARIEAMRSAVADKAGHAGVHLDFYDRNRLATWIRGHPGLAMWVRQKTGRGISGWQAYASWAASPNGVQDEYLVDDKVRLHAGIVDDKGFDVAQGIDRIRDCLRGIRGVVRLTGLSGVGKTRLVQALFDTRVGQIPLDPASVIYTDMNDNPSPQPMGMASDLIASQTRAVSALDYQLCEDVLEEALGHQTLGAWFPVLQASIKVSAAGAKRLIRAVTLGKARVGAFRSLGHGSSSDSISGDDLRTIVGSLAKQEHGYGIACDILWMRLHLDSDQSKNNPPELIEAGRDLLSFPVFSDRESMRDHHLKAIASSCLPGVEGESATRLLCEKIKLGFVDYTFRAFNHEQLLRCVFQVQPKIALDVFFGAVEEDEEGVDLGVDDFDDPSDFWPNPLDGIATNDLFLWCDERPAQRYIALSRAVSYQAVPRGANAEWTDLAIEMLKRAPNPVAVLEKFVDRFSPRSWSGSRAAILESRFGLLDRFSGSDDPSIANFVEQIRPKLMEEATRMRKWEDEWDSRRDERFE